MTTKKKRQDQFSDTFNELLGNKTGRQTRTPSDVNYNVNYARTPKVELDTASTKLKEVQSLTKQAARSSNKKDETPKLGLEERRALNNARLKDIVTQGEDDLHTPWWQRTLDVIARPVYSTHGALTEQARALRSGEPAWSVLDDVGYGAWRGLSGQEKYGFGDAVEEYHQLGEETSGLNWHAMLSQPLSWAPLALENLSDEKSKHRFKQVMGLAGEIFVDPYWGVGGKAVKIAKETGDIVDGADIAKKAADITRDAVKTTGIKLPAASKVGIGVDGKKTATFVKGEEGIAQAAADAVDNAVLEIKGGGQGGKVKFDSRTVAPVVANKAAEAFRKARLSSFESKLAKFKAHVNGTGRMPNMNALLRDPEFKIFHDELLKRLNHGLKVNKITANDLPKLIANPARAQTLHGPIEYAAKAARASVESDVVKVMKKVQDELGTAFYSAPGVRVFGSTVPIRRLGKAYDTGKTFVGAKAPGLGDMGRALSYEKANPGRLSLLTQKTKGMGIRSYDALFGSVRKMAQPFNKSQRHLIADAIDKDYVLSDPAMESARQYIKMVYRSMALEEQAMGVRGLDQALPSTYQYVRMKGGSLAAREAFRKGRKESIKRTGTFNGFSIADAKKKGLRPVTDPFEALLYRKMDSNKSLTKAWLKTDLLDHYGIQAKGLSESEKLKRGLKSLTYKDLPETVKASMAPDETWYLPDTINEVLDRLIKMTDTDDKEIQQFLRIYDRIHNFFKTSVTVPYPGFHVRNMIGDVFMGYLDGVRMPTYVELMAKAKASDKFGRKGVPQFKIADNVYVSRDELVEMYVTNAAAGGFYSADLARGAKALPRWLNQKLRDVSESREDFGRLAHFLHALREEYPAALSKKTASRSGMERAIEASVYRVNKYKFDYSALTAAERKGVKRVIPFYTYTRKALPTLLEAMFLTPKNLARIPRITDDFEGGDNFLHMLIPNFRREFGYVTLKDEEEPWIMDSSFMPTSIMDTFNFESAKEFTRAITSQISPQVKTPFELASGKQLFSDSPIKNTWDYLGRQFGPYGPTRELIAPTDGNRKVLSSRWTSGLPIRQVTERQQDFRAQELKDKQIDDPFKKFNKQNEEKGIRIYMSQRNDGTSFRVINTNTDEILAERSTPAEALIVAQRWAQTRK